MIYKTHLVDCAMGPADDDRARREVDRATIIWSPRQEPPYALFIAG